RDRQGRDADQVVALLHRNTFHLWRLSTKNAVERSLTEQLPLSKATPLDGAERERDGVATLVTAVAGLFAGRQTWMRRALSSASARFAASGSIPSSRSLAALKSFKQRENLPWLGRFLDAVWNFAAARCCVRAGLGRMESRTKDGAGVHWLSMFNVAA